MTTSKGRSKYDVFINFRGKEARRKFVCHLYRALLNAGVNTFLDEETLGRGTELGELMRVIQDSQIAVVVFSKAYTESSWCLLELQKIIECNKNKGLILLPVFYYIEPSHVRDQKGAFGKKLKATAQNTDSGALSRWSHALREATRFSGLHVRNYRNEAELVNKIVEEVLSKLEYDVLSTTTNFPVGLESRVQDVIRLIEKQSHRVCMLGIWGMGGLGKTTTAKFIYDRIHSGFRRKSFIGSIRNHRDHVPLLQEQLLWDILKIKVSLVDVGMGTTTIKNRLAKTKALIVLDDVDDCNQLRALCGNREWFGQGTVIIITTRNLRLLHQFEVDYPYELHKMDEKESLALFSWHAFGEVEPRKDFNELAKDAVAYCDGLPLALQCLGSDLRGRTEREWKSVLSKLKIIPIPEVQKNLKISYDGLDEPLQDIFLDICCVFIGEERDYVIEILNGCGLHADIGIPVLTERSLIKVENNSKLGMHPLVRDMGREIIRLNSKKHGKPSRLWFQGDVLNVLKNNTGTEFIEGLALKLDITNTVSVNAAAFDEMKKLRLLRFHHVQPDGDYGCLSKQLRWINWHGFPLENMPNNFCLEGVIAMDFKHSNLRLVWQEPKVLSYLKVLNLSHSKYLTETPDFSNLPSLEKLILEHCPSLHKVHQSVGDLCNLELINLKGCTSLSNLPKETYKLKSLKILILSGCSKIKLEEEIGLMKSLTTLIAENTIVKQVPFSIVSSKGIGYIFLCGFKRSSQDIFPSIIRSWMSPTINPLYNICPFCGISSSSLVPMNMKKNDLRDLTPILSSILNLRSVLVQCDTKSETSEIVRTILDEVDGVNLTKSEIVPNISEMSKHSLRPFFIRIGSSQEEVFNILRKSIYEELKKSESFNDFVPKNNHPHWLAHTGNGHSVRFTVPEPNGYCMNGMTFCVVYLSTHESATNECLATVIMANYTKCTIQIHKRDTKNLFNEVDWQDMMSHLESGDQAEFFVTFRHGLAVKKLTVCLMYEESSDMKMKPVHKPPINTVYTRKRKNVKEYSAPHATVVDKAIKATWNIPMTDGMRRKVFIGEYIHESSIGKKPPYPSINNQTWKEFVQEKLSADHQEIRKKYQTIAKQNVASYTLSRLGYDLQKTNKMKEKVVQHQQRVVKEGITLINPPSPPLQHNLWKDVHKKKNDEYTTDEVAKIAQKILEQQSNQGTFVPHGQHDILAMAIGKPELLGQVKYQEDLHNMEQRMMTQMDERLMALVEERVQSYMHSFNQQHGTLHPYVSTKGSFIPTHPDPPNIDTHTQRCKFFLDGVLNVVAFDTHPNIVHRHTLDDYMVRMPVNQVIHGEGPSSTETGKVLVTMKTDVQKLYKLMGDLDQDRSLGFPWSEEVFGIPRNVPMYITWNDLDDIIRGTKYLNISIMHFWLVYLHELTIEKGNTDIYGFLEPESIQRSGNTSEQIQVYMQNWMHASNKEVYLSPYYESSHWQLLIILPKECSVVWICSLHRPLPNELKKILEKTFQGYQNLQGNSQLKSVKWESPRSHKQIGDYECGYYVMYTMRDIINADIQNRWTQVFNDCSPLSIEKLQYIREIWSRFFIRRLHKVDLNNVV